MCYHPDMEIGNENLSELTRIYGTGVLVEHARMHEADFLDEVIADRTKENPEFPAMVAAAIDEGERI